MATTITSNTVSVDVTLPPVNSVVLSASPTTINGSGTVSFTATVTGGNSVPIPNVSVSFYDNSGNTLQGTATTDSSGVATFSYTYSLQDVSGSDEWDAVASGVTSSSVYITLNAVTYTFNLAINGISSGTVDVTAGTSFTAAATLTSGEFDTSGVQITLTDTTTGATYTATTDSSGTATYTITISQTGTYVFQASYTLS